MKMKRILAGTLALAMVGTLSCSVPATNSQAAKKYVKSLSVKKSVTVAAGESVTVTAKVKTAKKVKAKVKATVNKKSIVAVKVKGNKITITGKKKGKAVVTVQAAAKNKITKKIKVTVKKGTDATDTVVSGQQTSAPAVTPTAPVVITTATPTVTLTATPTVTPAVTPADTGIADVKVSHRSIVTVTFTSSNAGLTEDNFNVQTKSVQPRDYARSAEIQKVRTTDGGKTYDIILDDDSIYEDSYVKVTATTQEGVNAKEIFVESIAGYGYGEDEIERVRGMQGTSYSDDWYIYGRDTVGTLKYTVTGLPAGLKVYYDSNHTSVTVRGVFANIEDGTTATLTGVDEKGQTFKKSYVFYVGAKKKLVGNVLNRTVLSYTPDDTNTKENEESGYDFTNNNIVSSWACISGGSGSYQYSVSGLPAAVDTMTVEGNVYPVKVDEDGNYVKEEIPAGTYNAVLTVTDRYDATLSVQLPFTITVTDGVTVTGSVKDATGAGVKQVKVYGETKMDAYGYRDSIDVYTKTDGTYSARVIPGHYYVEANGYDLSIGNNFTAAATKDFSLPVYKVTFDTDIAGAAAYWTSSTPYLVDARGRYYSIQYDKEDYSLFVYLRKGSYEMQAATGLLDEANNYFINYNNTVYAYSKVSTISYKDGVRFYVSDEDRVGERAWQVTCDSFTVAGAMKVTLTGTMLPENAYSY